MTTAIKWKSTIEGWGAIILAEGVEDLAKRDQLVALLEGSDWYKDQEDGECSELGFAIADLKAAPTAEDADQALWQIYNLADDQRVWLNPIGN